VPLAIGQTEGGLSFSRYSRGTQARRPAPLFSPKSPPRENSDSADRG
jgi:hypothetical protein